MCSLGSAYGDASFEEESPTAEDGPDAMAGSPEDPPVTEAGGREGLSLRPKEYFKRQIYASFWFESFGPRTAIPEIGENNVMFEVDFPHPTCLYPQTAAHVTEVLKDLDPGIRRKVLHDNAANLYKLPEIS